MAPPIIHGMSRSPEYNVWRGMFKRCYVPAHDSYRWYGARGITVCKRWHQFVNFYADMGPRPPGTTLDRIDSNRGYSPSNCRWATWKEQGRDRNTWKAAPEAMRNRRNIWITRRARYGPTGRR